jgi:hypothetical protein
MNPALIAIAIQEAPAAIELIRQAFMKKNPDAPAPTNEEVIAAYQEAFRSSIAKDEQWLAAHPES